ncbi:MAG: NAD(P)/FAD-dependent oxidoreductase [Chloroflexi bacterium]|nr:MAG: NAD(P)/FAD-dependent oxidoreductase [Chloroflexota bacterium]
MAVSRLRPPRRAPSSSLADSPVDAVVVGSGPNGLAAAIRLAQTGKSVTVLEAEDTIGGGARSGQLTLPGFVHDICSAVPPLAVGSAFFRTLPLERYGLEYVHPAIPLAHPLDSTTATLSRSIEETSASLGADGAAYARLMGPLVRNADFLMGQFFGPIRVSPRAAAHPLLLARFGLLAIRSTVGLAKRAFKQAPARALFAGLGAHSIQPLETLSTGGYSLMLGATGHAYGWPVARGGSQKIADALAAHLRTLGGTVVTGRRIAAMADLPPARAYMFDVTPRQLLAIAGDALPPAYRRELQAFRYGPGVFKVDWALEAPIPWRDPRCLRAGTVHLGGTLEEIAASERAVGKGQVADAPFVLLSQPSLFDDSRAPATKHTVWAYCHVPNGSTVDMTARIEAQIERFAPGFTQRILARNVMAPADIERHNANCVGGDINGGSGDLRQWFLRPTRRLYATPNRQIYICSSSTPPTGGVHGLCGYFGAETALRRAFR